MKVNVLCVSPERFKAFNEIYKRYFPKNPPARIFFCVPVWTGPFDIEIECIASGKTSLTRRPVVSLAAAAMATGSEEYPAGQIQCQDRTV